MLKNLLKKIYHYPPSMWVSAIKRRIIKKTKLEKIQQLSSNISNIRLLKPDVMTCRTMSTSLLTQCKNIHNGERVFLLGNGPSVRYDDLNRLHKYITFAANRFFMAYENMSMRPTYTVCIDLLVLKQHGQEIANHCGTHLFISDTAENSIQLFMANQNIILLNQTPVRASDFPQDYYFSSDARNLIGFGFGVIYAMMQLAVWMGAKELCLYGIDHTFTLPKDFKKPGIPVIDNGESNHFIKNYRDKGEKWAPPNPKNIEAAFLAAKDYCERNEIKVWNCTRGGKLKIFERRPIDEVLSENR